MWVSEGHLSTRAFSPPPRHLSLHLKNSDLSCSLAQKAPQGYWDCRPVPHFVWGLPQVVPAPVPLLQPASGTPSQLLETHCQSSASQLLPSTLFLIWTPPLGAMEEGPGISVPGSLGRALFPMHSGMGSHRLGVPLLLAPRLTDCYLCCREGLIHVLLSWGYQLSTHVTCVLLCGGVCHVGWCMGPQAGAEWCLLQTWTSVPRPCMTAAPARIAITCPAPTSAPALTATARLGLNVWVSPGRSLSSPCSVPLAWLSP